MISPSRLFRPALCLLLPAALLVTARAKPVDLAPFQAQAAANKMSLVLPTYPTTPDQIKAQAENALKHADEALAKLAAQDPAKATFASTFAAYDSITAGVTDVYLVVSTVAESAVDKTMRDTANEMSVKIQEWSVGLDYREPIYRALKAFADTKPKLEAQEQRLVDELMRNYRRAGLALPAFELGVDISMHALTKYPSGGADVLMGSVVTRDLDLHHRILMAHGRLGIGVAANDVETLLRSLPTIALRYHAHDASARQLAHFMGRQTVVKQVLHPALPGSPGHAHWAATCTAAAGLFSVMLDPALSTAQVDAFVDGLRLFKLGYSWGGPTSLVVPYDLPSMRADVSRLPGHLVRFSIGLEAVDALQADLAQALARLG